MITLLHSLGPRAQAGSKPRCHWLTHGANADVATRLNGLASRYASVTENDRWMPRGFDDVLECQLHKRSPVLDADLCDELGAWWLAPASSRAATPNFDIASTCTVGDRKGLLLIEAKAHRAELANEEIGRRIDPRTPERVASHGQIGRAIEDAARGLTEATGLVVRISRDNRYQMSNRFAWSWKLASKGLPVVLVYLGFTNAKDRSGWDAMGTHEDWTSLVMQHSEPLFPNEIWNRKWWVDGTPFVPLIRTLEVVLPP